MKRSIVLGAVMCFPILAHAGVCDDAAHRAFDFWLGDWTVRTSDGKVVGRNAIRREYDGCVVHEHYTTPRGYSGESLNVFDASRNVWHQTWVDSQGTLLILEGRLRGAEMVLEGALTGKDGRSATQRITWTPNADGSVRQLWQSANADGTWATSFDGLYRRE